MVAAVSLALAISAIGATSASAWAFATQAAPQSAIYNNKSHGDGAGNINRSGFSKIIIDVSLRDRISNGNSIYQKTAAWFPTNLRYTGASVETGRRSGSTWAAMQQKQINTTISSVGVWTSSKVCEDASLRPDICSTTRSKGL